MIIWWPNGIYSINSLYRRTGISTLHDRVSNWLRKIGKRILCSPISGIQASLVHAGSAWVTSLGIVMYPSFVSIQTPSVPVRLFHSWRPPALMTSTRHRSMFNSRFPSFMSNEKTILTRINGVASGGPNLFPKHFLYLVHVELWHIVYTLHVRNIAYSYANLVETKSMYRSFLNIFFPHLRDDVLCECDAVSIIVTWTPQMWSFESNRTQKLGSFSIQ